MRAQAPSKYALAIRVVPPRPMAHGVDDNERVAKRNEE